MMLGLRITCLGQLACESFVQEQERIIHQEGSKSASAVPLASGQGSQAWGSRQLKASTCTARSASSLVAPYTLTGWGLQSSLHPAAGVPVPAYTWSVEMWMSRGVAASPARDFRSWCGTLSAAA